MLLFASVASAQDVAAPRFDGQLFRPSVDATSTLWLEDTHAAPDGYATARAFLQYARAPVRWEGERLVSDLVGVGLAGAYSWKSMRLGFDAPVYLYAGGLGADQPGIGDLGLHLKGSILDREEAPVGLALVGRLALPTASVEVPLGATAIGWELMAAVDRRVGDLLVVGNLGTRGVPRAEYEGLVWNDQVFGRVGGGYAFLEDAGASLELAAQTNWSSARNPAGTAAELLAGGWGDLPFVDDVVARGGLSFGLSRSPGAPLMRVVLGASWEPDMYPDRDLDGIVDRQDWCPADPEDPDGFEDADGCHDASFTARIELVGPDGEDLDGVVALDGPEVHRLEPGDPYATLHPGEYRATASAEGFVQWAGVITVPAEQGAVVTLPLVPEIGTLAVWAVDPTGAPIPAALSISGGDALVADGRPVEVDAGEHALLVTAPGYRAEALSVDVGYGQRREVPVILEPAVVEEPPRVDERVGRR